MSGITGHDGYIYQSIVGVALILQKLSAGIEIKRVRLEVRLPSEENLNANEFIVDIVIESINPDDPIRPMLKYMKSKVVL